MKQAYKHSEKHGLIAHKIIVSPPKYDESKFVKYDVEMLGDCSGYSFRLIASSIESVDFPVAWIKNKYENLPDYEADVEFCAT